MNLRENSLDLPVSVQEAEPADFFELRDRPATEREFFERIKKRCESSKGENLRKSDTRLSDEFEFARRQDKYESLKDAQLPLESLAVRIWAGGGLTKSRIFSLQKNGDNWAAWHLKYSFDKKNRKILEQKESLEPQSDWNSVWAQLENEQILNLPDASEVET